MTVAVPVLRLPHGHDLPLPAYATTGSAGVDLLAAVAEPVTIQPGSRALIPTGIAVALPEGYEAQVRPRSGLAVKHGLTVLNSPGTVDADYRGEIKVCLVNLGAEPFVVERRMRIAQMVVARHAALAWSEVPELPVSGRGEGGFGSSGTGA
jgi:dUTP pyrophosphatase